MMVYVIAGAAILAAVFYVLMYNRLRRLSVKVEEGSAGIDVALEKRCDMLSEEIEAVKKFLKHEYDTYVSVTSVRAGKELEEETLKDKRVLSEEALKTIDETIEAQQAQVERLKKQLQNQPRFESSKKRQERREAYESSVAEQKMNINQKISMLASIRQGLGGVGTAIDALSEQYPVLYSYVSVEYFQKVIYDAEEHLQAARRLYNANVSAYNQTILMFPFSLVAGIHGMKKADFYEIDDSKKEFSVNFEER